MAKNNSIFFVAITVAIGGFLMGFDASVISGTVKFISLEFDLSDGQLGFAVASLTLTSTLAMMVAGPISDRIGRKRVLLIAASLFFISALYSALAANYVNLVIARLIGGLGVGSALIIPPMYIAEIAPPKIRGRLVSFNQLNIVIGLSVAFFTNYYILNLGNSGENIWVSENNWRLMLGLESIPAILYFLLLFTVPESPRWLALKNKKERAFAVLSKFEGAEHAQKTLNTLSAVIKGNKTSKTPLSGLFKPAMRFVLTIGIVIAILQQITGINAVFFYAPMIFEQTGIGTDASFANAIIIGLTNLVFTILAMLVVDKFGRKPLLSFGLAGIIVSMLLLSYSFSRATYSLDGNDIAELQKLEHFNELSAISAIQGVTYHSDIEFKNAVKLSLGNQGTQKHQGELLTKAITINSWLVLFCIIGFVASFAFSLGPVMWILFSELFPDKMRGLAISFVGLINSAISFSVQQLFPWELSNIGSAGTYLIYGVFALLGLVFVLYKVPETKGKSLEELEDTLIKK